MSKSLLLKHPHSILAALQNRPSDVRRLTLPSSPPSEVWAQIQKTAKQSKIKFGSSKGLKDAVLEILPKASAELEDLFESSDEDGFGVWIALDCLQDPQNVGAIFRSASFFGAKGIIMLEDRAAPMSSLVYDISSGGVEEMPFCQTTNLRRAIEVAKNRDVWVMGTSEHAKERLDQYSADRNWLIVLGSEEKGIRRLTSESCDTVVSIPSRGGVTSLNVSVAAGVLMNALSS